MAENFYNDNEDLKFHLTHPEMERIVKLKEDNFSEKDQYDYAPNDFEDAVDSYVKVMEIIGEICGETIAANAEDVDKYGPTLVNNAVVYAEGTQENIDKLTTAGLFGIALPRKYDGLNFSMVPYVMSAEIVSRADAGFGNIWGLQDCAETILEFASEELKDQFLPRVSKGETMAMDLTEPDAGSDLQSVQLKATLNEDGEWILNGVKRFITNGDADISLVLARSEEGTSDARGLSLFVYDRKEEAMSVRRIENKLGIKGSPTCELVFKDAPAKLIGDRKMGLIKYVMSLMNGARLGVGAQSVGIAEEAYREALKYAHEREQFGKAIIEFPAVYEMLTLMKVKINAIRSLLYETSRKVDIYKAYGFIQEKRKLEKEERMDMKKHSKEADILTPLLKGISSEYCNQIAYDSLQIHGGTGYMKDFPIERIFRDARITTIYEGTTQLQVVAAIRGIGNGGYLKLIESYEAMPVKPALEYKRKPLYTMKASYIEALEKVNAMEDDETFNFHARRLVEMIGNIVMGHLLVLDAERDEKYANAASIFINKGIAENAAHYEYIANFVATDLPTFKIK